MPYQDIEDSRMYRLAEEIADEVWEIVIGWPEFARQAVGTQLVRSADSIGANLAESAGRFHPRDVINFLYYSRGSIRETRWHLKRSVKRELVRQEQFSALMAKLDQIGKDLNGSISYQKSRLLKESGAGYIIAEPVEAAPDEPASQPTN